MRINAAHGGFYIGQETVVGPCAPVGACDTYLNTTAINFSQDTASGSMYVDVPGGQTLYVAGTGELSYTPAGNPTVSADGYKTAFIRAEYFPRNASIYAAIDFKGKAWVACPVGDTTVYQVSAQFIEWECNCIPFEMEAIKGVSFPGRCYTWQYS